LSPKRKHLVELREQAQQLCFSEEVDGKPCLRTVLVFDRNSTIGVLLDHAVALIDVRSDRVDTNAKQSAWKDSANGICDMGVCLRSSPVLKDLNADYDREINVWRKHG
jgi:hypothetical protein